MLRKKAPKVTLFSDCVARDPEEVIINFHQDGRWVVTNLARREQRRLPVTIYDEVPLADPEDWSTTDLGQSWGFTWLDCGVSVNKIFFNAVIEPSLKGADAMLFDPDGSAPTKVDLRFAFGKAQEYSSQLALVNYDEQTGLGVVYHGKKPIPEGTMITLYSGQLVGKGSVDNSYLVPGRESEHFKPTKQGLAGSSMVCARQVRNWGGLLNHMPKDVSGYEFAAGFNPADIATANVGIGLVMLGKLPLVFVMTTREIKSGESLGMDYGPYYWPEQYGMPSKNIAKLFYQNGRVVESWHYRLKTLPLTFPDCDVQGLTALPVDVIYREILWGGNRNFSAGAGLDKREIPIQVAVESGFTTLWHHRHPILKSHYDGLRNYQAIDAPMIAVLRTRVHPGFKGLEAVDLIGPQDEENGYRQIDAVLETSTEEEMQEAISRMAGVGLYPKPLSPTSVVIEYVNDSCVASAIKRLEDKPCLEGVCHSQSYWKLYVGLGALLLVGGVFARRSFSGRSFASLFSRGQELNAESVYSHSNSVISR